MQKLLISTLVLCIVVIACGSTEPPEPTPTLAKLMCQDFVKQRLKAPTTAKFQPTNSQTAKETSTDHYVVGAYVDSQNSFGAMIRTQYVCEVEYRTSSDKWYLVDLVTD